MKKHLLVSIAVIVTVLNAGTVSFAQDRGPGGGWRSGGGFGGHGPSGGSQFASGFVPSIVADVLLVPSLTKPQQTKIRTIYMAYRGKSLNRMEVMSKLRSQGRGEGGFGEGGGDLSKGGSLKDKETKKREDLEAGMEASSANLRKTLFMSMLKESEKFHQDMLLVLNEKQKSELKEIAAKAGSPDYFTKRHYDFMNSAKSNASGKDRPD